MLLLSRYFVLDLGNENLTLRDKADLNMCGEILNIVLSASVITHVEVMFPRHPRAQNSSISKFLK